MEYVVCYDIADDARRSRAASALLDFGHRAQETVFVAHLDGELAARMVERLRRIIDETYDRVHVFEMCGTCSTKTITLGTAEVAEDPEFYIF
jgi:CRISPR-associated protein Cas2